MTDISRDQRWFWAPRWQSGERQATAEITEGETTFHADADAMFAHLNRSNQRGTQ